MPRPTVREIGEAVALLGVVSSLVFVGLELRQNRIAARAAAYQELGIAVRDSWLAKANNRELNDLVDLAGAADSATWADLSESDVGLVRSYVVSVVRLYETVYLQVEQGLLEPDALESLGWIGFLNGDALVRMWPQVRPVVTPAFATYLEGERAALANF